MRKKVLIFLFAATVVAVGFVLVRSNAVSRSVKVTFLCYTNCDAQGGNAFYTWAWFRIENRGPYTVGCYQGPLDVQRAGKWFQDTNNVGRQLFWSRTPPGQASTIAMVVPENATRWRSSFLFERQDREYINYKVESANRKSRFAAFMDNLHLERLGLRSQPWKQREPKRMMVTSETIDL